MGLLGFFLGLLLVLLQGLQDLLGSLLVHVLLVLLLLLLLLLFLLLLLLFLLLLLLLLLFLLLLLILVLLLLLLLLLLLHLHGFDEVVAGVVVLRTQAQGLLVSFDGLVELLHAEVGVAEVMVVVGGLFGLGGRVDELGSLLKSLGGLLELAFAHIGATDVIVGRHGLVVLLEGTLVVEFGIDVVGVVELAVALADVRCFFLGEGRQAEQEQACDRRRSAEDVPAGDNLVLTWEDEELNHQQQKREDSERLVLLVVIGEGGCFDLLFGEFVQFLLECAVGGVGVVATGVEALARLGYVAAHIFVEMGDNDVSLTILAELTRAGDRYRTAFGFADADDIDVHTELGGFLCSLDGTFLVVLTVGDEDDGA